MSLRGSADPPSSQTPQWDPRWELTSEEFKSKCDDKTQQWLTKFSAAIGEYTVHEAMDADEDTFMTTMKYASAIPTAKEVQIAVNLHKMLCEQQRAPQGKCEYCAYHTQSCVLLVDCAHDANDCENLKQLALRVSS